MDTYYIHIFKKLTLSGMVFILSLTGVLAQFTPYSKKVHKIGEVEIVSNRYKFYGEDQKKTIIDSAILSQYSSANLGEMLSKTTPLHIKSYGSRGSLSIPSLRGSTSNHTTLTWNGFPINSITLGQCDLSKAPMEFMEKVSVTHGASGSLYGSGTFGGNINLENDFQWDTKNKLALSSELGSWNNQRYNIKTTVGNNAIKYRLNGIYQSADNDFTYHDTKNLVRLK